MAGDCLRRPAQLTISLSPTQYSAYPTGRKHIGCTPGLNTNTSSTTSLSEKKRQAGCQSNQGYDVWSSVVGRGLKSRVFCLISITPSLLSVLWYADRLYSLRWFVRGDQNVDNISVTAWSSNLQKVILLILKLNNVNLSATTKLQNWTLYWRMNQLTACLRSTPTPPWMLHLLNKKSGKPSASCLVVRPQDQNSIPSEIYKAGGPTFVEKLTQVFQSFWVQESIPQELKNASIVLTISVVSHFYLLLEKSLAEFC